MADLRINGWSNESLKCQHDLDLKRELVALLSLSSWCLVMVVWLFLAVPWVCLRFVIVYICPLRKVVKPKLVRK